MKKRSLFQRFLDIFRRTHVPTGGKRLDLYSHDRDSLRDRFNRVRSSCTNPYTREEHLTDYHLSESMAKCKKVPYLDPSGSTEGYNVKYWALDGSGLHDEEYYRARFNLMNMTESCCHHHYDTGSL